MKYWYWLGKLLPYVTTDPGPQAFKSKRHATPDPVAHRGAGLPAATGALLLPVRHLSFAKAHPCLKPQSLK